jgi:hypothetical protein
LAPLKLFATNNSGEYIMRKKLLAIMAIACAGASPTLAVVTPFGGPATGTDPLGDLWSASGTHWGEPGFLAGGEAFNPLMISNDAGNYATSFSFTFLKGVGGTIDQTPSFTPFGSGPETRFTNLTDGVAWLVSYSGKTVTFTAPDMAAKLDPGDLFFVNVWFTGPIDTSRMSFAGLWDDAKVGGVPEPASWALMVGGFGLLGTSMRRQRRLRDSAVA